MDFSQAGEQDILVRVFELLPPSIERWCVEFGAWDGKHLSNTYHFISTQKWNGVLIEQDTQKFELLKATYPQNNRVTLLNKTVNFEGKDTLDNLLSTTPIPINFDLLSIDIDGNDWHVWDTVKKYTPKVVVIEFNPTIPSDIEFIQPKSLTINQGTSLLYIVTRAKEKGYELVNTTSCNAFFIQKQLFPLLNIADNSIQNLWKTAKPAPRLFQLYDGTLVLDKEFGMLWRKKVIGKLDLQIIPTSERIYSPKKSETQRKYEKLNEYKFLQNSCGVIHIGANYGQERDIYQFYNQTVLWIEALPEVFATLQHNIATYTNQTALKALLLDVDNEDFIFYISNNHAESSSIYPLGEHKKLWPKVDYTTQTILHSETLTKLANKKKIDVTEYDTLVIDTQGSELRALKGGAELLWGINTIYIETTDCELYKGGCSDAELAKFLNPFGFTETERMITKSLPEIGSCYNVLYQKTIIVNPNKKPGKKTESNSYRKKRFKNLRNNLNTFGLPPFQFQTETNEIVQLISLLRPYSSGYDLKRFGPEGDGGYLVPDDLCGIEACYSPGVGKVMGFEKDCFNMGMKVFLVDKSVEGFAQIPKEFHFMPKYLGKETKSDYISMSDWLLDTNMEISGDLLLQMDIEGYEYESMERIEQKVLNQFRIIVIELHFLDLMVYKPMFEKIEYLIRRLTNNHTVVHLHPNNCCGIFQKGDLLIPRILEVTLLRNDRFKEKNVVNHFPHPLDKENVIKPPLILPIQWYSGPNTKNRMKAIVLTYDRNVILTEHMIKCYEELWPNHPFVFRIPYQDEERQIQGSNREYIRTPSEIKETILGLLADLNDEEWVYWCMDDKYPIQLELVAIESAYKLLSIHNIENLSGVLFCRVRKMLNYDYLITPSLFLGEEELIERKGYHQIWIHQFIKVKVIRNLFNNLPSIDRARTMDPLKHSITKPKDHRLFVTSNNHAIFGESSVGRVLTRNCYQSMLHKGMNVPSHFKVDINRTTIIGTL